MSSLASSSAKTQPAARSLATITESGTAILGYCRRAACRVAALEADFRASLAIFLSG